MTEQDLCTYWESIANELKATKDRVRNLIGDAHYLTDGSHKEILLRKILQRHLPEELSVCTGFVCKKGQVSNQIDILVLNRAGYTLFKEDELVIVTPHAVRAIVEVKTRLTGKKEITECVQKLARNGRLAEQEGVQNRGAFWCGLFVYEDDSGDAEAFLKALSDAETTESYAITCVAYGLNLFVRFHPTGDPGGGWVSHSCEGLAPGCFIMDMVATLTRNPGISDFSIFNRPILDGRIKPTLQIKRGQGAVEEILIPEITM